ncbi:NAD(P)H-binding protein [Amycolatopsis rubida]|uniref:NAD(P)H-binding protein n=1 Tax=Amycolatopsis rubida TaxID=112413 RepID=A0ABX0BLR7_9PSEU|nr:NAD(P)H-binding protein [Amycolatopsis sp. M39]MYW91296.1 NAD(P)H-binding protein [Amycolatopsis rubida]NEC56281.1 NAD(P)H-binding protein [Amycolatopsis rubida]OAP28873.1 Quinone oxidoreductase 2 [Amycolatopsis sp. M39]
MAEASTLVFGATGALGQHVLGALVSRGVNPATITAAGRNPARLAELASAGFRAASVDLSDAAGVAELVTRHSDIVLISGRDENRLAQHESVIEAAKNVRQIYYTSGVRADDDRFEINADHRATEKALVESGVPYTILRNTWYIENYVQSLAGPRFTGVLAAATGDAVVAAASRKDLAEALAVVVTTDGHDNVTYSLSGDTDFTYADIAEAMSVVLEREVAYQPVAPGELRALLSKTGMPDELAGFLVSLDETIAAGVFARVGDDLSRLLGRPTTGLVEGLTAK